MLLVFVFVLLAVSCFGEGPKPPNSDDKGPSDEKSNPLAHGFGDDIEWVGWNEAILLSEELNKPIFLLIHKTWCGACQSLKGRISKDPKRNEFVKLSKKFVMVNLEDDEEPQDPKYAPDGGYIPRLFFLDKLGDPFDIDNREKYAKNPHFYPELDQILNSMNKALKEFASAKYDEILVDEKEQQEEEVEAQFEDEKILEESDDDKKVKEDKKNKEKVKKEEDKKQTSDKKSEKKKSNKDKKEEVETKESAELKKKGTKDKKKDNDEETEKEEKASCPHAAGKKAKKEAEKKKQHEEKSKSKDEKVKKTKKTKEEPKDEL